MKPLLLRRPVSCLALLLSLSVPAAGTMAQMQPQQRGPIQLFPDRGQERQRPPSVEPGPAEPERLPLAPQPAPGEPDGSALHVEGLEPPGVDATGLAGGFKADLWRGAEPGAVLTLLERLPGVEHNPPLAALTRRLLITGASVGAGPEGAAALAARIERLLAMGALDEARALAVQLPAPPDDPALARTAAQALLWAGDDEAACKLREQMVVEGQQAFWSEIDLLCRVRAGDDEGAGLALDLLREAGADPGFLQLAAAVISTGEVDEPMLMRLEAVDFALSRQAGLALPAGVLTEPSLTLLAALMREPELLPGTPLPVFERAFEAGLIGADELRAAYQEVEVEDSDDLLLRLDTAWSPAVRAQVVQRLGPADPPSRAEIIDATWRAASGDERFLVGALLAPSLVELPVTRELVWLGPSAARALLAADQPVDAARWFSLVRDEGFRNTRARSAGDALAPLFALAGFGGSQAVPEPDQQLLAAWRRSQPAAEATAPLLLALLEGVGAEVPTAAWAQLVEARLTVADEVPTVPLWRGAAHAQARRQLGPAVLYALHLLDGDPAAAHPETVVHALTTLRAVGLDQEARRIAVATALRLGL